MTGRIELIEIDWGMTDRRAWALAGDGRIVDQRADGEGLLAVPRGGFLQAFSDFTQPWRQEAPRIPVLMCGMVGSKLGWVEAPYLPVPADLNGLARSLCA